jgi:hypothetical protein
MSRGANRAESVQKLNTLLRKLSTLAGEFNYNHIYSYIEKKRNILNNITISESKSNNLILNEFYKVNNFAEEICSVHDSSSNSCKKLNTDINPIYNSSLQCNLPVHIWNYEEDTDSNLVQLQEFLRKHVSKNQPAVVRGLFSNTDLSTWNMKTLIDHSSNVEVQTGHIPYESLFQKNLKSQKAMNIGLYYREHMMPYLRTLQNWAQERNLDFSLFENISFDQYSGISTLIPKIVNQQWETFPLPHYIFDNKVRSILSRYVFTISHRF